VDNKVDVVDKAVRAELQEVDEKHNANFKAANERIQILELGI